MATRVREDEKNERIIRGLLKLPENRRCINCNSLGPQYVCTNFWTFVCTNCSGIHREFTHRVKSISMAKFTSQEVSALQGGGNASAKEIYFKEWDPQRQSFPDGSNVERLRDFIKHVYVDRRYSGERSFEKPPRSKGDGDEFIENRRNDMYQGGSRSPPSEDAYERRYGDRPSSGGRSPGYEVENRQYGDNKRSPARVDVVNDWRREDRFGNGRRPSDGRISDASPGPEGKSPDRQSSDLSSPPVVRPVRDILGENVSPLRVIEPPKANGGRPADSYVRTQRTASSSSLASSNGNPAELKVEASLIDFDAAPGPSISAAASRAEPSAHSISRSLPATTAGDNWASFDSVTELKVSQASGSTNSLESVFSGLSVPASVPGQSAGLGPGTGSPIVSFPAPVAPTSSATAVAVASLGTSFGNFTPAPATASNSAVFPTSGGPTPGPGQAPLMRAAVGNSFATNASAGQWTNMQPQQYATFPGPAGQAISQQSALGVGGSTSNQAWSSLVAPTSQGPATVASNLGPHPVARPGLEVGTAGVGTEVSSAEAKSSSRRPLPEDLFTMSYASMPAVIPGWHPSPGVGFPMQYNMPMPTQMFAQPSKSTNPFDVLNEASSAQTPSFPSMASLQGAIPNVVPQGLLRTASHGAPTPASYHSGTLPQAVSYGSAFPPGSFMGPQAISSIPPRPQGYVLDGTAYGSLNPNMQLGGLHSAPATQNIFPPSGGNPFG